VIEYPVAEVAKGIRAVLKKRSLGDCFDDLLATALRFACGRQQGDLPQDFFRLGDFKRYAGLVRKVAAKRSRELEGGWLRSQVPTFLAIGSAATKNLGDIRVRSYGAFITTLTTACRIALCAVEPFDSLSTDVQESIWIDTSTIVADFLISIRDIVDLPISPQCTDELSVQFSHVLADKSKTALTASGVASSSVAAAATGGILLASQLHAQSNEALIVESTVSLMAAIATAIGARYLTKTEGSSHIDAVHNYYVGEIIKSFCDRLSKDLARDSGLNDVSRVRSDLQLIVIPAAADSGDETLIGALRLLMYILVDAESLAPELIDEDHLRRETLKLVHQIRILVQLSTRVETRADDWAPRGEAFPT
jgi:hypothetical protein